MTNEERRTIGLLEGAKLSIFATLVKQYTHKWGATPFDGFVRKLFEVKTQSTDTIQEGDRIVYHKTNGTFYLMRTINESTTEYYPNWPTRYLYSNNGTYTDRFFVSPEGYVTNGKYVDFDSISSVEDAIDQLYEELKSYATKEELAIVNGSVGQIATAAMGEIQNVKGWVGAIETNVNNISSRVGTLETSGLKREIVDALPEKSDFTSGKIPQNVIYMLPVRSEKGDYYNEYMWVEAKDTYELIGSSQTSLEGYTTVAEQNRLVASTVGLVIASLSNREYKSIKIITGDKVKIVNSTGADISEGKVYVAGVAGQETIDVSGEYTFTGDYIGIWVEKFPAGTRFFITNNNVTNVGLPHLTDDDIRTIFNNAEINI